MEPEMAFNVIAGACASVNANLQQHQQIQQALEVLRQLVPAAAPANGKAKAEKD